jgi:hypothetical protein
MMGDTGIVIFDPNEPVYNLTWEEWTKRFWNWLVSIPKQSNPANDDEGIYSNQGQQGNVFFLPGTIAGALSGKGWRLGDDVVRRIIHIPQDKAVFVAVQTCEVSQAEFQSFTNQDLMNYASRNNISDIGVEIDGIKLDKNDLNKYRINTGLFDLTMVADNIFDAPAGKTVAAAAGYYLILAPRTIEEFTIHFWQTTEENPVLKTEKFAYDVTDKIIP